MTITDSMPTMTKKRACDLFPGDIIIHTHPNWGTLHDIVVNIGPMPGGFGVVYDDGNIQVSTMRRVIHPSHEEAQWLDINFTVNENSWYNSVLSESDNG